MAVHVHGRLEPGEGCAVFGGPRGPGRLPGRRAGRRLPGDDDAPRHLVIREPFEAGALDLLEGGPVRDAKYRRHRLAEPFVRNSHDDGFEHSRNLAQDDLDLGRRDVDATGDDDLLLAPHEREVAVLVQAAYVAAAEPAVD